MSVIEETEFFTLHQAAEGVWAAIAVPGSGAQGNAAIVDLGDVTIVVDTFMVPQAAEQLRQMAIELTGRPIQFVVNTHYHGDHHYGNQAFSDSIILSTEKVQQFLSGHAAPLAEDWQAALRQQIAGLIEAQDNETDPRVVSALRDEIADKERLHEAAPAIRRVTASITFTDKLTLHGSKRTARIITYGGGHTLSDAFIYIPEEKVLIAGDLILEKTHPAMLHGDLAAWPVILERIRSDFELNAVIPGHGSIAGPDNIDEMLDYLNNIQEAAKQAAASGITAEEGLALGIPQAFADWTCAHVYGWNFRWLYNAYTDRRNDE
ncbi:MBL fold metallo-hydrolase [Paenibacillus sp. NFR01]|uniref:MBL fold metallo-hydrolase n=1 Tax=Paenibacillus sp. NFR01 TaxID=1566279 RepID=UPI0008B98536|nr:MBL fold metallo-hydrolase [Paenibacillus sp. NFR01]SET11988.1 Glyoxylase, beta-lactamase superfamily II [Paenibacillus sp. NFR01]